MGGGRQADGDNGEDDNSNKPSGTPGRPVPCTRPHTRLSREASRHPPEEVARGPKLQTRTLGGQEGRRLALGHGAAWRGVGDRPVAPCPHPHLAQRGRTQTHPHRRLRSPTLSRGPHEPSAHSASGGNRERHALTRHTQTQGHTARSTRACTHARSLPILQFPRAFYSVEMHVHMCVCLSACVQAGGRRTERQRETEGQ